MAASMLSLTSLQLIKLVIPTILLLFNANICLALQDGWYCGADNCYELLGASRDASKAEISKLYRQLARQYHPDANKDDPTSADKFMAVANAYEILKDEDQRQDYDYLLDNPDKRIFHYYNYYRTKAHVDVRVVIAVIITVISAFQYYASWYRYTAAIKYLSQTPKYQNQALDIASAEGLLTEGLRNENLKRKKGKKDRLSKEQIRKDKEELIKKVLADRMDIRGGHSKPSVQDILWVKLFLLPYRLTLYCKWYLLWIWNFTIKARPYGREEKLYLIRKHLNLSQNQYESLKESQIEKYFTQELWVKENAMQFIIGQQEEARRSLADNSKYKAYRRYVRSSGPGRIVDVGEN